MRKVVYTLFILMASCATVSARSLLDTFIATLSSLDSYATEFTVTTNADGYNNRLTGRYFKQGANSYTGTYDIEYFIVDGVKYEVNASRKEIVIDNANTSANDIFVDPIGYFANLAKEYKAEDTVFDNAKAVTLTPKDKKRSDRVVIVADSEGLLPYKVIMEELSSTITIVFEVVKGKTMPTFDRSKYIDFEVIDMR